jgi:hypothetical protein
MPDIVQANGHQVDRKLRTRPAGALAERALASRINLGQPNLLIGQLAARENVHRVPAKPGVGNLPYRKVRRISSELPDSDTPKVSREIALNARPWYPRPRIVSIPEAQHRKVLTPSARRMNSGRGGDHRGMQAKKALQLRITMSPQRRAGARNEDCQDKGVKHEVSGVRSTRFATDRQGSWVD